MFQFCDFYFRFTYLLSCGPRVHKKIVQSFKKSTTCNCSTYFRGPGQGFNQDSRGFRMDSVASSCDF